IFRCLTGSRAFGDGEVLAMLARIALQPAPRLRDRIPDVPQVVEELVGRMLANDRGSRPSDCASVAEELRALLVADHVDPYLDAGVRGAATPSPVATPTTSAPEVLTRAEQSIVS